ncbi:type 2 isopentenyl-diphosphate Delta-isomerase [Tepidanaerobacter sp. EBM-49]|uniref:type 2 isopentenyl-diphosphate Delta-isomerase n=1 Tax=Tepidanaerobacter sp. EBM-49 TaxID=1918504 RepID=UPI00257FC568|nr:type 2 isopentenyl-diphosphate Delta-isomerase [Tepidanaerobacter sp. EBM-49]
MDEHKRKQRKDEHIKYGMLLEKKLKRNAFDDITILHNCLSEVDMESIDISTKLQSINLENPIIINAITGGTSQGKIINGKLAGIAKKLKVALAVGSQKIALNNKDAVDSFKIVRKINPDGVVFANLSADSSVEEAKSAIEMIKADAIQLHLNVPQEVVMKEGQKKFTGLIDNIANLVQNIDIPIIVKEVGFGIAKEEALILAESGVKIIDVSGKGGTNFIEIEGMRGKSQASYHLRNWGIPTPISLIETIDATQDKVDVISSGGLKNGVDAAKSLALGAKAVGFAGYFLHILLSKGSLALEKYIIEIQKEIKYVMAMSGARNLEELKQRPVIINGKTYHWLKYRGIKT